MGYNKSFSDTSIRIGEVRFSYVNVFTRKKNEDGSDGKYGVCLMIPKNDSAALKLVKDAIEAAKSIGKTSKWGGKLPGRLSTPLRDGDEERPDDPNFAGMYFMNANSNHEVGVKVLENGAIEDALGSEDFYSGCWGVASLNFFAYDSSGNKGVGCGLNNVIKTRDDERLGGGRSADQDFGDLAGFDPLDL